MKGEQVGTGLTAIDFLSRNYRDTHGHIDIVTKSDSGTLDSERFFEWPRERKSIERYIDLRADEDVYMSAAIFSDEHRTKDDTAAVANVVWADADTCAPDKFRLPPSITVETSPGRWHCYWLLDETVPAKDASEASHRIAKAHQGQGCDISGWIVSKLLRVPGTMNTKDADNLYSIVAEVNDTVYTLDTINDVYGDIDIAPAVQLSATAPKPVAKKRFLELEEELSQAGLTSLYLERPAEGESWSERLFRLELELFRLGMTPQEVFSLAREASCNKYNPEFAGALTQTGVVIPKRNDPDGYLWKDVQKAYAEYQTEVDIEVDPTILPSRKFKRAEFLEVTERRWVTDNPSFIDLYTQWVATRTDSAETYQRSLACLLLSSVFGGRGYLPLKHGNMELNLWLLLLGDTTRTRKTTAKRLYMKALHRFENEYGEKIDVGTDATAEGLIVELGKRNGKVSLLHKDEITGFFSEMFSKSYRTGTIEVMTDLYDGDVPVVLRAGKESGNKKRARTIFNFLGVGIRKRTAEILTRDYFESGFLARMVWSVADPPPRVPGSEDIEFDDDSTDVSMYDGLLEELLDELVRRSRMWSADNPSPIRMDKASLNRYNKWAESAMQVAEGFGDGDVIVPSFQRMKTSVLKVAALLAMYEQESTITMRHLLPAIAQGELWFNDMLRMASEVSSSEFERRLDNVEAFVSGGVDRKMLESAVRRKFAKLRPREFEEVLTALLTQGRIKRLSGAERQTLQAL